MVPDNIIILTIKKEKESPVNLVDMKHLVEVQVALIPAIDGYIQTQVILCIHKVEKEHLADQVAVQPIHTPASLVLECLDRDFQEEMHQDLLRMLVVVAVAPALKDKTVHLRQMAVTVALEYKMI